MDIFEMLAAEAGRRKLPGFFHRIFNGAFPVDRLTAPYRSADPEDLVSLFEEINALQGVAHGEALRRLKRAGLFAVRLPKERGGRGFSLAQTSEIIRRLSEKGLTGALTALLRSLAFQRVLLLVGSEEQKAAYLPRLAAGEEAAVLSAEGETLLPKASFDENAFRLNGEARLPPCGEAPALLAVPAEDPSGLGTSLYVIETGRGGPRAENAGTGLRFAFENTPVPRGGMLGETGQGREIVGAARDLERLLLSACTGPARACLKAVRERTEERTKNAAYRLDDETAAGRLADIAARLFAMEAVAHWSARFCEGTSDMRQEAAAAFAFHSICEPLILEDALRLLETDNAAAAAAAVDAMTRRAQTGAGASAIGALALEATRRHLRAAGTWLDPGKTKGEKLRLTFAILGFYLIWYPACWIGWGWWPRFRSHGKLAGHLRFADRTSRQVARAAFHGTLVYRSDFEARHAFHERLAEIGLLLYAMSASIAYVQTLMEARVEGGRAADLADAFCRGARLQIRETFSRLWKAEDSLKRRVARELINRRYLWLEKI